MTRDSDPILLTECQSGPKVCVEIRGAEADVLRLKRLGLCPGLPLELVTTGDPMILTVVGTRIGMSRKLASQIVVTNTDPA